MEAEYLLDRTLYDKHLPSLGKLLELDDVYPMRLTRDPFENERSLQKMFGYRCDNENVPRDYLNGRYIKLEISIILSRKGINPWHLL